MEVPAVPKAASPEALEQHGPIPPVEGHLPRGRLLATSQPHPTPLVTGGQPAASEPTASSERLRVAQARTEITGTGAIVDTVA